MIKHSCCYKHRCSEGRDEYFKKGYSILVKFEKGKSFITPYLKSKGFKPFGHGYRGCDWIWVLLDRKKYAYGMPGIKMADTMYDHAVTVEEYNTILKLYEQGIDQGLTERNDENTIQDTYCI